MLPNDIKYVFLNFEFNLLHVLSYDNKGKHIYKHVTCILVSVYNSKYL